MTGSYIAAGVAVGAFIGALVHSPFLGLGAGALLGLVASQLVAKWRRP